MKTLRTVLPQSFPGSTFSFLPADMVSQVLNFGAPAPIDVQVAGPDPAKDQAYATELVKRISQSPAPPMFGCSNPPTIPTFGVDVDRTRAGEVGISERDVTNSHGGQSGLAASRWRPPFGSIPKTACPIPS